MIVCQTLLIRVIGKIFLQKPAISIAGFFISKGSQTCWNFLLSTLQIFTLVIILSYFFIASESDYVFAKSQEPKIGRLQKNMNSELTDKVTELAEENDVPELTRLLVTWPDRDAKWLLYIDSRLIAPSTTQEQRNQLLAVREQALKSNPQLEQQMVEQFSSEQVARKKQNPSSSKLSEDFTYTEEDQIRFQIIETLEDFEDWQLEDIDDYLDTLHYSNLDEVVQHAVNQTVYGLLRTAADAQAAQSIASSSDYQTWYQAFAPESVLKNDDFGLDQLIRFDRLNKGVELIKSRDYYAYLLERGDKGLGSFNDYLNQFSYQQEFSKAIDDSNIEFFEKEHNIKLPQQLKNLYLAINPDQTFVIPSLLKLEYHLSRKRSNYEHLKGMGVINMLAYVWSNDKQVFEAGESSLSETQIKLLNNNYIGVGSINLDDNVNIILYYDKNGHFGAIWYDQDNDVVFTDYLDLMLERSQAKYNIFQLITVIPFIIENSFFKYEEQEKFIANLRAIPPQDR